jgi:hypothetical protein
MRATTSVHFRLLAAGRTAILLLPLGGPALSLGFGPEATSTVRAASEGGHSFSPSIGTCEPVNVRALAARSPTDAPDGGEVPLPPRTSLEGFVFLGPDPVANPTSSTLNFPLGDTPANGVTWRSASAGL